MNNIFRQLSNIHMDTNNGKEYASMHEVVMKKTELLEHLIENKAKHDVILTTAISGYWEMAEAKIKDKQARWHAAITEMGADGNREFAKLLVKVDQKQELPSHISFRALQFDSTLGLAYPQDHSRDYERAIRMMQSSVHDEVKLTVDEYDAYVLNNWEWKNNFLAVNTAYVNNYVHKYSGMAVTTGNWGGYNFGPQGTTGPQGAAGRQGYDGQLSYNNALKKASMECVTSGAGVPVGIKF